MAKFVVWFSVLCVATIFCGGMSFAQQPPPTQQHGTQAEQYPELPAGAGRDTLIRVCSKCHSPDRVIADGQDEQGWENTISKMANFGATGSDDDFSAILDYLVANFPPNAGIKVKINEATAAQLERELGLSTTEAEAIVSYRKKNGAFKSINDLNKVPGVGVKKLDAKKARLIF